MTHDTDTPAGYAEQELPMLAGIAGILRWFEELLNIVNGPLLLFGAGVALVDLLTDGALTVGIPLLLFAWAISQALGIDTQLLGCFARARNTSGWPRVGWLLLGLVLGFAAWQAGDVFAVQQAQHISEAAALAQLHVDPAVWLGWRAFLAVGLVALSGWTRYRAPAKATLSDERAKLERELALEPLRQRLRAQQVGGMRALAVTALQGAGVAQSAQTAIDAPAPFEASQSHHTAPQEGAQVASPEQPDTLDVPTTPDRPPTGPGSPSVVSKRPSRQRPAPVLRLTPERPQRDKRTAARANARSGKRGTVEQRIRAALEVNPTLTHSELVRRTGVSDSSASKYMAIIAAERAATSQDGQVAQ